MKKHLQFLALLVSVLWYAQTYKPLLQQGNKWYEKHEDYNFGSPSPNSYTYFYINGEETKNGIVYKKMLSNMYCYTPDRNQPCSPTGNADQFYKLMRENVAERKVYYYDEASNSDVLLYDFTLNTGAVHPNNFPYMNEPGSTNDLTIDDVVQGVVFGRNVRSFDMNSTHIYEGIGSNRGLLHKPGMPIFEGGNWLICFEDAASGKSCESDFHLGTAESSIKQDLKLFYSRENREIAINGNSAQRYIITFFDVSGKTVEQVLVTGRQKFSLKNVVKGQLLFYTISDGQNLVKGKIIL